MYNFSFQKIFSLSSSILEVSPSESLYREALLHKVRLLKWTHNFLSATWHSHGQLWDSFEPRYPNVNLCFIFDSWLEGHQEPCDSVRYACIFYLMLITEE